MKKLTIFLGGSCGSSTWRNKLIPMLNDNIDAFNPIVEDWTPECQEIEDYHKANDDINLFVITPETKSTYSLFEIGVEATKNSKRTVVCFLDNENGAEYDNHEKKSIKKIAQDLKSMGVEVYDNLEDLAFDLNNCANVFVDKNNRGKKSEEIL